MNKTILKTALITVAALAAAALLVFSTWILCAPQSMAAVCERTGNYSFAITCADLRYKYTGDTADLARCVDDSIFAANDKFTVEYGGLLTADENFDALCAERNENYTLADGSKITLSYKVYVCGNIAAAEYRTGDTVNAIRTADIGGDEAFTKLAVEIKQKNDKDGADKVISALEKYSTPNAARLIGLLQTV